MIEEIKKLLKGFTYVDARTNFKDLTNTFSLVENNSQYYLITTNDCYKTVCDLLKGEYRDSLVIFDNDDIFSPNDHPSPEFMFDVSTARLHFKNNS